MKTILISVAMGVACTANAATSGLQALVTQADG